MSPDDPRHGTTRGFHAGCLDHCCRAAISRYQKTIRNNRLQGRRLSVPAIGAQRRLRALMALGWTGNDIAAASAFNHRNDLRRILVGQKGKPCTWVERHTHEMVCEVYDLLSMRVPKMNSGRARCRTIALRRGWPPPLAWDDETIDDPDASPKAMEKVLGSPKDYIDPVVVERILAGDNLPASAAEKREVVRLWTRSHAELARITGWKVERYAERSDSISGRSAQSEHQEGAA